MYLFSVPIRVYVILPYLCIFMFTCYFLCVSVVLMLVRRCTCFSVRAHMYACNHAGMHVCTLACVHVFAYLCVCVCKCLYICIQTYLFVCLEMFVYAYIGEHNIYACICIRIKQFCNMYHIHMCFCICTVFARALCTYIYVTARNAA